LNTIILKIETLGTQKRLGIIGFPDSLIWNNYYLIGSRSELIYSNIITTLQDWYFHSDAFDTQNPYGTRFEWITQRLKKPFSYQERKPDSKHPKNPMYV
jgi:hypothetical protein